MKTVSFEFCSIALAIAVGTGAAVIAFSATNEPPLLLAPPTKLQSVEAAKTNVPVPRVEQSGNSGTFEEGVIFGALAFARNPDVRDPKVIVEIARGLWQAQKRADAQRQTNSQSK